MLEDFYAVFDSAQSPFDGIEPRVDAVEPAVDDIEPERVFVEYPRMLVELAIDAIETLGNRIAEIQQCFEDLALRGLVAHLP